MIQLLSAEQLGTMKIDMNNISLGDNFYGLVQTNTEEFANNTTANSFLRIGEVANKSQDGIEVDFSATRWLKSGLFQSTRNVKNTENLFYCCAYSCS